MRSSLKDLAFVTVNLAVFACFGWMLYADFTARIERSGGVRLGTITYKKNIAERKYGDRVLWEPLPERAELYDNDTLRTAGNSEAVVELDDGTRIELAEETLIMLARSGRGLSIDFRQGAIAAKGGAGAAGGGATNIEIKSGDTAVALDRADASFSRKDGRDFVVDVARGRATVARDGKKTEVRENERAVMTGTAAAPEIRRASIVLRPGAAILLASGATADAAFAWTADGVPEETLEVSAEPGFAAPVVNRRSPTRNETAALAPGTWYWRVRGADGAVSRSERLTVLRAAAPEPLAPANGQVHAFHSVRPLVNLQWVADEGASGYDVEIATDPGFAAVALRLASRGGQIATDALGPGDYWWRVRARFAAARGQTVTGQAARFSIVKRETPPAVGVPATGGNVTTVQLQAKQAALAWRGDPEFVKYTVEISTTPSFDSVVHREVTPATVSRMRGDLPPGSYYWRVTGVDAAGKSAAPSAAVPLVVSAPLPARALYPADGATILAADGSTVPVAFGWFDPNRSGRVRLEVAADAAFGGRPVAAESAGGTLSLPLATGAHYWRLSVLDGAGQVVATSPARRLAVLRPLPSPELRRPAEGSEIDMAAVNAIDFSWSEVPGATAYEFSLYYYGIRGLERVFAARSGEAAYRFTQLDRLDRGGFVWEVRAVDHAADGTLRTASPPAKAGFRIKLPELKKTVILTPGVIYVD